MQNNACILVCVTTQKSCARLIHRGRELAVEHFLPLKVIHVSGGVTMMGNPDIAGGLDYLYAQARECNAEMEILFGTDIKSRICAFAREHHARYIVLGRAATEEVQAAFAAALCRLLPGVEFVFCE